MKYLLITILAISSFVFGTAASQAQQNVQIVTGEIVSVKISDRTMTIKGNARGQNNVYQVPETMKILKNGREIRLRALNPGDLIEAKYFIREDVRVLTNLDFDDPEDSETPMTNGTATTAMMDDEEEEVLPTVLPKTATSLPLYGLIGFLLLAFAGVLRLVRTSR